MKSLRPEAALDPGEEQRQLRLTAFHASTSGTDLPAIIPAPRWRDWMNETESRFANRCLPLLMANESGWVLGNPVGFEATWEGGSEPAALTITFDGETPPREPAVSSLFGYGIVTWSISYLFRTPPGYNLLVRGPANHPKDGVAALEGLVEADWATATFTMNWKLTRAGTVRFDAEEPFCMVVPQRRSELESFAPEIRHVSSDAETGRGWAEWVRSRDRLQVRKFLGTYSAEFAEYRDAWEQDYFRGRNADGRRAPEHETKRRLRAFRPVK